MKRNTRALVVAMLLVSLAFATPTLVSVPAAAAPVAVTTFDSTSDSINATVATIQALFLALIPIIIMVNVFGVVIGMFIEKMSSFGRSKYR